MAHLFELTVKMEGRRDATVRGALSDDEHAILRGYLEEYENLWASKPLREGFPCSFKMQWEMGSPVSFESSLPDADTLSILLHRLRPFVLDDEPFSFTTVCSVVGKNLNDPGVRSLLRELRRLYDGRRMQSMYQVSFDDVVLNSERVLKDWLNSHEYHRDPDKREAIDALFAHLPNDFLRAMFVSMLVDKVKAIRNLASLVHTLLTKGRSFQFQAPMG
jgi:hypothetical protein